MGQRSGLRPAAQRCSDPALATGTALMIPPPPNTIDLRGKRYGRLSIPEAAEPVSEGGHVSWPCDCDCGTKGHLVRGTKLRTGKIVSCGCYRADPRIRQAATLALSAAKRKRIARIGGAARAARCPGPKCIAIFPAASTPRL